MKKAMVWFLVLALVVSLTACRQPAGTDDEGEATPAVTDAVLQEGSWVVYWYLCGSNLESENGFATADLEELFCVSLPENVTFVIQTGGAYAWQNDFVNADALERYVYDSEGLTLVDTQPLSNMGEQDTLASFLQFASESYPAENTALLFWNHGGGSVTGAAFDEQFGNDALTLCEMLGALSTVYTPDAEQPPLELIGFDTCLMATVDVAGSYMDYAHYLVASEEYEPGNGWYYCEWAQALADDPTMDGEELGRIICDAYVHGCEAAQTQDSITLSLTDLTKLRPLLDAYETYGAEALQAASEDPSFFSQFGRAAVQSENYGGNTREQGYANMVDLGHLARQTADWLGSAEQVLSALDDCVLYQVCGPYRTEATGLSCFYSYDGDIENFDGYTEQGIGSSFKYFYEYELTGTLHDEGMEYLTESTGSDWSELPEIQSITAMDWNGAPLDVDEDGVAYLTLGEQADALLTAIGFTLCYQDPESDIMLLLGTDNDIIADWENGIFYDNFRGVWGSLDGQLVYMELSYEGEDYNLYSVPVLLNDEQTNLQVVYDFTTEQWSILGVRQGMSDEGMAEKELYILEQGDVITPLWYMASVFGDDDFEPIAMTPVVYSNATEFGESALPDGSYFMCFEMTDAMGNHATSQSVTFDCFEGEIYTTVGID